MCFRPRSRTGQENPEGNPLAKGPPAEPTKISGAGLALQSYLALSQEGSYFCQDTGCARGEKRKHRPFHGSLPGQLSELKSSNRLSSIDRSILQPGG